MSSKETVNRAIHAIFGNLSDADIERITEAGLAIGVANMHYGLNSQVAANENKASIVRDVLDRMPSVAVDHMAGLIGSAHKHPHDRALIAFAADVLCAIEDHKLVDGGDTTGKISISAQEFGLATTDDEGGSFQAVPRSEFQNPLNL